MCIFHGDRIPFCFLRHCLLRINAKRIIASDTLPGDDSASIVVQCKDFEASRRHITDYFLTTTVICETYQPSVLQRV